MKIRANGLQFEVAVTPAATNAERGVVVLVAGLGLQLVFWPQPFIDALARAGFRVVRFDNRDVGLSQHLDELGVPNIAWQAFKARLGLPVRPPYTLSDMAADTIGIIDALELGPVHLVGLSMGGMIAQRVALAAPGKLLTLTSIMSSSGARNLPGPKPEVLRVLFGKPEGNGEDAIVNHNVKLFRTIGSPGFPIDESVLRERVRESTRRSFHPQGTMRQMTAVMGDTRRARELGRIALPTLVLHGKDDPLVPVACGHDTARRIPGACFVSVPGMGHDLPPGVVDLLMQPLLSHLQANAPAPA